MKWTSRSTRPGMMLKFHLSPLIRYLTDQWTTVIYWIPRNYLRATERSKGYKCILSHQTTIALVKDSRSLRRQAGVGFAGRSRVCRDYWYVFPKYTLQIGTEWLPSPSPKDLGSRSLAQVQELGEKQRFSILGDSKEGSIT